jgi:hypothetical protein
MAAFNKFNSFIENLAEGINCATDTFKVAFVANANTPLASNTVLANLTQATTNADSVTLTVASSEQTSGTYKLLFTDKVITATAGGIGPFRYVVIYDDTPTSPADPLVGWYDYTGTATDITMAPNETLTIDWTDNTINIAPV